MTNSLADGENGSYVGGVGGCRTYPPPVKAVITSHEEGETEFVRIDQMKNGLEKGRDRGDVGGGGCRTSPPETVMADHGGETRFSRIGEEDNGDYSCGSLSSSSSSIGRNSDDDDDENDDGDAESRYRRDDDDDDENNKKNNGSSSFEDAIQALEEALPIRRGISSFYNGKSKSFTSLADVWSSSTPSVKDNIAKPENAYTRKRRNLLASNLSSPTNKSRGLGLSSINAGRISKRPKTAMFLHSAPKIVDPKSNEQVTESTTFIRPSLVKQSLSSLRSFSMVNLHQCSSPLAFNSTKIGNC